MALIHVGTWDTLADIDTTSAIDVPNGTTAHIFYNARSRVFTFDRDNTPGYTEDGANHPYYLEPTTGPGIWIEEIGNTEDVYNAYQIATGVLTSLNWSETAGSEYDLDVGTIKLGGSLSPKFSITAAGVLTAVDAIISGALSASTIDIGGSDDSSFHVDIDGNMWLGAATYNIATNPFAVSKAGLMRAVSGSVGGFTLAATTLTATNLILDAGNQRIKLGTGNDIITLDAADATYRLAIGHATYASATFRVTKAGVLTATGANITGNITGGSLIISNTGAIYSTGKSSYADTDAGFFLGYDTDAYKFNIGDATRYIKYDGSSLTINVDANVGTGVGIIYKDGKRWLYDFNPANNGTVTPDGYNLFLGVESGNLDIGDTATETYHSSYNIGVGYRSLYAITKGYQNIGIGRNALLDLTEGYGNIAIGSSSLENVIGGYSNVGIGAAILPACTSGYQNIGLGFGAFRTLSDGYYNVGIGTTVFWDLTSGYGNVAIGHNAAGNMTGTFETGYNCIYIGHSSLPSISNPNNEIAIGYNTTGNGSNTVTIGNTSIIANYFEGAIYFTELSSDPTNPAEGQAVMWMSDGTGAGDDGDIMMKVTAGSTTKTITLVDFSSF